jgi:Kef-type K+ transport system membrane component KefB
MEAHTFFLYLLIILLSARLFAELAVRLNSPSVIGELLAGVVIGPSVLGWIEPVEALKLMAEIGIILLLFEVGLGTDLKRLVRSGAKSTQVAIIGFIAPLLFGYIIGLVYRFNPVRVAIYWRNPDCYQYWHNSTCTHRLKA